jgi:hypothetical protein
MAEASLARFERGEDRFVTVIRRDENERREAERQIERLRRETEVLRNARQTLEGTGEIPRLPDRTGHG